ncbi:MAG: ADP-ribosylglycohydrolase family protein [Promethearchaeota archaeon]
MKISKSQIQGMYWGLALGDALGKPVEFEPIETIRERFGDKGILEPLNNSIWTDDTEMTIAVTRALLRLGNVTQILHTDLQKVGKVFAEEFINWLNNPGYSPGITCTSSVYRLEDIGAENWELNIGNNDSKGCGSVMRTAPLGLWFAEVLPSEWEPKTHLPKIEDGKFGQYHQLFRDVSQIQSELTHGHKAATAAALAGSFAVALALNGIPPAEMINPIEKFCGGIHPDFDNLLDRLKKALKERVAGGYSSDLDAIQSIGDGWVGDEAFCMALYACIRHSDNYKRCIQTAVNHSGDSDSVGCIAGSILGAFHGMAAIPQDWINRLKEKSRLESIIDKVEKHFNQKESLK